MAQGLRLNENNLPTIFLTITILIIQNKSNAKRKQTLKSLKNTLKI